jgi:nicotinamide mononucleotide (NMN) deamidase PncC
MSNTPVPYSAALSEAAERIVKLASEQRMTLATVESCTAGSLLHLLSQSARAARTVDGGS